MNWQPGKPTAGLHRTEAKLEERVVALENQLKELFNVITIKDSGALVTIEAVASLSIKSGAALTISAGGVTDVKGAILKLNGGAKPIARLGDPVNANLIIGGSPSVLG